MAEEDLRNSLPESGEVPEEHIVVLRINSGLDSDELNEKIKEEFRNTGVDLRESHSMEIVEPPDIPETNIKVEIGDKSKRIRSIELGPPIQVPDLCPKHDLERPCPYGDYF